MPFLSANIQTSPRDGLKFGQVFFATLYLRCLSRKAEVFEVTTDLSKPVNFRNCDSEGESSRGGPLFILADHTQQMNPLGTLRQDTDLFDFSEVWLLPICNVQRYKDPDWQTMTPEWCSGTSSDILGRPYNTGLSKFRFTMCGLALNC
jgi:hypothetical protein